MILARNNVPQVYTESRDYLAILKLLDLVANAEYEKAKLANYYDPNLCEQDYLPYLAKFLGYDYDFSYPSEDNILIMKEFPTMLKNKGTKEGILEAAKIATLLSDAEYTADYHQGIDNDSVEYDDGKIIITFHEMYPSKKIFYLLEKVRPVGAYFEIRTSSAKSISQQAEVLEELTYQFQDYDYETVPEVTYRGQDNILNFVTDSNDDSSVATYTYKISVPTELEFNYEANNTSIDFVSYSTRLDQFNTKHKAKFSYDSSSGSLKITEDNDGILNSVTMDDNGNITIKMNKTLPSGQKFTYLAQAWLHTVLNWDNPATSYVYDRDIVQGASNIVINQPILTSSMSLNKGKIGVIDAVESTEKDKYKHYLTLEEKSVNKGTSSDPILCNRYCYWLETEYAIGKSLSDTYQPVIVEDSVTLSIETVRYDPQKDFNDVHHCVFVAQGTTDGVINLVADASFDTYNELMPSQLTTDGYLDFYVRQVAGGKLDEDGELICQHRLQYIRSAQLMYQIKYGENDDDIKQYSVNLMRSSFNTEI